MVQPLNHAKGVKIETLNSLINDYKNARQIRYVDMDDPEYQKILKSGAGISLDEFHKKATPRVIFYSLMLFTIVLFYKGLTISNLFFINIILILAFIFLNELILLLPFFLSLIVILYRKGYAKNQEL